MWFVLTETHDEGWSSTSWCCKVVASLEAEPRGRWVMTDLVKGDTGSWLLEFHSSRNEKTLAVL